MHAELQNLEKVGIIKNVEAAEWISAMVVAKHKDGALRNCVDLCAVNEAIVPDVFPLPHVVNLLIEVRGAKSFSKLDALAAYHQLKLEETSRDLTASITPWGPYRYKRIYFGLASALAAFQGMMCQTRKEMKEVLVYLDDILIFGNSGAAHDERFQEALRRIESVGMILNEKFVLKK